MFSRSIQFAAILLSASTAAAAAQSQGAASPAGAQPTAPSGAAPAAGGLPKAEIEKLVAAIALYPDVLISQILPAATFPTDIVMAARWVEQHPDLKGLDDQKWDLSVISVCRYKPVLDKMNQDLDWTNALGAAFMDQPDDVMNAIQDLREQARNAGVLKTTPQQTVVTEETVIRIVPTEKEVVYVPQYDPQVVYVDNDDDDGMSTAAAITAGALSFGAGMALGAWLDNDCDWHGGCVVACRPGYWGGYGYRGAVAHWDNDWVAARGPRRGFVAGENGGVYRGPNGAAAWGPNGHGAAWARPHTYGTPAYTGRYSGYKNVSGNRRNVAAGNTINVNRNNVNIDRGDRNTFVGGDRNNFSGGNRNNFAGGDRNNFAGGDRNNIAGGNRNNVAGGDRNNLGGGDRANAGRDQAGNRPGDSRQPAGDNRSRSAAGGQNGGSRSSSAFGDNRGSREVQRSSSRGSNSRSASQGGGGRRGGGGGGRRR